MPSSSRSIPNQIACRLDEISALCNQFGVVELEVFGSVTTDDFDEETSDFDFLVEFDYHSPEFRFLRDFFGFKEALESLLGRPVDLMSASAIRNPYLKKAVDEQRVHLFAA